MEEARAGALARQEFAERDGLKNKTCIRADAERVAAESNRAKDLEKHFKGACGELALARKLGVRWDWNVGGDRKKPDVAHIDIRTASRLDGGLIIYPNDIRFRPHSLIVGTAPELWFVGWIYGIDGMTRRYLRESGPYRGNYIIPQADLWLWPIPVQRFPYPYRKDAA